MNVKIESSWKEALKDEFEKPYFVNLVKLVKKKKQQSVIYPSGSNLFRAYNTTPINKVKVVILGQDPYHGPGQAHGLSFSVEKGVRQPPSLQNIFKELHTDLDIPIPNKFNGDLTSWAENGVFLLNAILTVQKNKPASHRGLGWETFTDATIKAISNKREHIVFILWGNFARQKKSLIDLDKHHVITSVHPSPFSARNGFIGSKPFSKANEYLIKNNIKPVSWEL